ncbi:MAG: hypothetical protein R3A79_13480 [Nannocystaceae bacterium]
MLHRRTFVATLALVAALACNREGTVIPSGSVVAADFTGRDAEDRVVTLNGLTADGPAVLVFYRGFW